MRTDMAGVQKVGYKTRQANRQGSYRLCRALGAMVRILVCIFRALGSYSMVCGQYIPRFNSCFRMAAVSWKENGI